MSIGREDGLWKRVSDEDPSLPIWASACEEKTRTHSLLMRNFLYSLWSYFLLRRLGLPAWVIASAAVEAFPHIALFSSTILSFLTSDGLTCRTTIFL